MAIPTVAGVGAANHGTTAAVTYTLPSHQADDILLLVTETNVTGGLTAPTGWANVTTSPRAQGSNVTCLNVFWLRATSSAETNPQVPAAADHQDGFAIGIRGAVNTGNPWDFTPVGSGGAATSFTATGGTTSVADCLVIIAICGNLDVATEQWSAEANASLSSFAQQLEAWTTDGNGGGTACYTGGKAVAGATGSTTGTAAASTSWSAITLAIKPAVAVAAAPFLVMAPRIGV